MIRFEAGIAALAIGILISLAGPASAENVLRWASAGGAATFDPHGFDEDRTFAQFAQVYEPLIGLDSDLTLAPRLATAWRLVDPTTWEFDLRHNLGFHDGTPLTAEDVVWSFHRAKTELSPPVGIAHRIESIAAVRALDEHTVRQRRGLETAIGRVRATRQWMRLATVFDQVGAGRWRQGWRCGAWR